MIFIGADHRGFKLKNRIYKRLVDEGLEVTDLGNDHLDSEDDYPEIALKVATAVAEDPINRGILLCGSGVGVDIVANKVDGIRSALVKDSKTVEEARNDDNVNIISLPADELNEEDALEIIKMFLITDYAKDERFERRLEEIKEIEEEN